MKDRKALLRKIGDLTVKLQRKDRIIKNKERSMRSTIIEAMDLRSELAEKNRILQRLAKAFSRNKNQ